MNEVITIICDHCKRSVAANPRNTALWNGFYDSDTNMHVCWNCKEKYYKYKTIQLRKQGLFSEMPVSFTLNYKKQAI